ncbi:MAG TPA: NAD(P)-dependent alcohol dehydrogenase [Thermoanaerobaculia bacterium]|nr:NAD(P)-dependent alcohol dehydrogenase [Thermoanaerobaculia bacterium]
MRAVVYCDYGSPGVLRVAAIEKPVPGDDQVLVRVHAAAVNPLDYHYMRGTPYIMRPESGLRRPKVTRLGVDFSGTVEAVGKNVRELAPGDAVFGGRTGAFADYVVATERSLARKPANITFEQAAAVPIAAITALQAVRDEGKVQAGQRVLINGASGGVGTFAVQIAKSFGAHVTGVCSTRNVELVESLGADEVIDYTRQDYTKSSQRYDVVIDMVGNHSLRAHRPVLSPNGIYVIVGGPKGRWIAPMDRILGAAVLSRLGDQDFVMIMAKIKRDDLNILRELIEKGKVTPVIDRRYDLSQVREAMAYLETGRARGKVILTVAE